MDLPGARPSPPPLKGVESWIFDLDNTLYPASCGLFVQIDRKMKAFICELLGVEEDEAHRLQKDYFHRYGTTLRGLMEHHEVDPAGYLDYVHAVDFSPVLADPDLNNALARLPGRKFIFTNGPATHVMEVLARLGIGGHFEDIFDIEAADFLPKPTPEIYRRLLDRYGIDPKKAAMIDDLPKNLVPASALGMATVWLRTEFGASDLHKWEDHIHYVVDDLAEWLAAIPLEETRGFGAS